MEPTRRIPLSIVMLDSDPNSPSALIDILAALNVHVVTRDASLGIVRAGIAKHNPDVVFVDVNAPNVGGAEATRQIKRQFPDAKVIALSEYGSCHTMKTMLDAGACGLIFKSADPYGVRTLIERAKLGDQVYCQGAVSLLEQALPTPLPKDRRIYYSLKDEHQQVVDLIIIGLTSSEIADHLQTTDSKVKQWVRAACRKYRVDSRVELAVAALREGVDPYKDPAYREVIAKYDPTELPYLAEDNQLDSEDIEEEEVQELAYATPSPTPLRPADPNDLFEGLLDEWE